MYIRASSGSKRLIPSFFIIFSFSLPHRRAGENKLNMFAECKVKFSQNPTENNDSKLKSLQALNWCCECSLKGVQDLYIAHAKKPSQIIKLEKTTIPTLIKENVNIPKTL